MKSNMHPLHIRTCHFKPYRKGCGPHFRLEMFDSGKSDERGCTKIEYYLYMDNQQLFGGNDFSGSPMHADDSDDTVRALMGFLTLRPGDTDAEYFIGYSKKQLEYCEKHAESLAYCFWRGKMLCYD